MLRLAEALIERETLDGVQIRRVVAGLPLDDEDSSTKSDSGNNPPLSEESAKSSFKKPLLPPITGNNPATA